MDVHTANGIDKFGGETTDEILCFISAYLSSIDRSLYKIANEKKKK